ncbi:hypothetical protein COCON_G00096600 [Conger conger]|uniref:Cilia- and flagella-associated protein 206 n=1 Tax=Conger conger TaxID=82655 RepID=A0A9Q1DM20_CONCO|nr:cilia- and flagella-associated protein 206 [Conger conger]KAJ8275035.1 hypothetical protein COCON_G00096600 [Conger conger]
MSRAQAESVIKNIIREVAQECAGKGQSVSETLVAFTVKAVVLDPRNQFNVDRTLTNNDVRNLIELCVDRLLDQESPALDTIKMQVYFDMNYTSRRELLEEHQRVLRSRLAAVSREITESRVKDREELDILYLAIVSYVLLRSGVGSPTDINTVREATAALQSVFPQSEMGTFMSLLRKDKEQQLNELSMIVLGIRLFNRDSGKGGEGIDDLPSVLKELISTTKTDILSELKASSDLACQQTALLEWLHDPVDGPSEFFIPKSLLNQAVYNVRQHEAFLNIILADEGLCEMQVESLQANLRTQMKDLRATVEFKTAIPTAQVFPHFTALAKTWAGLQDEIVLLGVLGNMAANLRPFIATQSRVLPKEQLDDLLEGMQVKSDEQRMKDSSGNPVDPTQFENIEWLFPETTANFDKLALQFKGICGYTLVEKEGFLLPGNPYIGTLKHREKYYIFSSKEAACSFAAKPEEYIAQVAEIAKKAPELIHLLELHQQFASVTPYSEVQSGERLMVRPIVKCDSCTQTDTHLVETNIVRSYEWNEWELRRKAIKLANLQRKLTQSVQTDLSHMRRDNVTQTYPSKDASCQSKKDGQSNVPKPQVYLAGLRGGGLKPTNMVKANLTRAVDE